MTNLLPPTSWTERKRKELQEALPTLHEADKEQFIYLGCCIDFTAADIDELQEANDESWPGEGKAVELMREHCAGFDQWAETMGYVLDPSEGLTVENDQCLVYGKSYFRGVPCYFIDHSRIEYIWVDREYIRASFHSPGVVTGRMSCSQPNISNKPGYGTNYSKPNPAGQIPSKSSPPRSHEMHTHDDLPTHHMTPAEVARGRAMAKKTPNYSMGCFVDSAHSNQEMNEHAKQVVAAGMPFEHYARQEAAVVAMGLPLGDHEVTLDASNMPDEELAKVMADPLRQENKAREFGRRAFAGGMAPIAFDSQEARTVAEANKAIADFRAKYPEIADYSGKVSELLRERGVTCDTEKLQKLLDDANAVSNHSLKEAAQELATGFGDDPFAMKVIPIAISMTSMEKWGCPYCSYCQGSIPATAEGTMLWVCSDCRRGCHVLADGLEMSAIAHLADIYPQLTNHPSEGTPKRTERRDTSTHVQDSNGRGQDGDSQDTSTEGLGDSAEGK